MTHEEMLEGLKQGRVLVQDSYASRADIEFINDLERDGKVVTWDASLEQETRRKVRWKVEETCDGA
jgi:hypothetical protein